MDFGCFEWYFIKNGAIIGVEDATTIIAILISTPTPIVVE